MRKRFWCWCIAAACAVTGTAGWAQVKDFPSRPVRMIVPVPPGGSVDVVARILGQKMSEVMGQNVVIEHRPGASTNIGSDLVVRATADGHTLLINTLPLVVNPSLFRKMPFTVEKDLAPVSLVVAAPFVLVVHPSVPVKSVKELIALARTRPGKLNYSSAGNGTNLHVAAELFKSLSGTNMVHVPYAGGGPALVAILSGESDLSFLALVAAVSYINAGRMRAIAITSSKRSAVLPNLPTIAEAGVPGYEFTSWVGVLAPAATPVKIVATLNDYIVKAARAPAVMERFAKEGADLVASSPEQFAAHIKSELARWAKVVKESGMRAD